MSGLVGAAPALAANPITTVGISLGTETVAATAEGPRRTLVCTIDPFAASATCRIVVSLVATKPGARVVTARVVVPAAAADRSAANNLSKLTLTAAPAPPTKYS